MDDHALRLLEFEKIRAELTDLCVSPQGVALVGAQGFFSAEKPLAEAMDLVLAMRACLESGVPLPGLDFPDVSEVLPRLGKAGLELEGEELAGLGRNILSAMKLSRHIAKTTRHDGLREISAAIPDLSPLSRKIFHMVDPEGNLKEKRIPGLSAIRERIRRMRDDAERAARSMLDAETSRAFWQSDLPTQRDGRLVLPLKAQFRGRVKGIVHELSGSGSTIFIEPMEIVEKNNSIVQEENAYRLEVRRILRDLSAEASSRVADIGRMTDAVARLDALLCRSRYAVLHRCRAAEPGLMDLRDARHPLLGSSCVPITVAAGGEQRVLIITGPNTGGKTVSLKTVGVLSMMNQFAMEIPAAEGSSLPVFDAVFTDIGDEQSIEQSLSTFSAHIANLARIVKGVTARSLVLLDELGAGTDPEEGVALAMALLDRFLEAGPVVLVTTHHGILKNYGYTRSGVQNASMGFDKETLSPTFRILMGVPGESHALEIARRRGLPTEVVKSAESYLKDERSEVSEIVSTLSERHQRLAQAEEEQKARLTDLREKTRRTDLKELSLRQKELELRRQGLKEMRDFLSAMRGEWQELKEKRPEAAPQAGEAEQLFGRMRERIEGEEERIILEQERMLGDETPEIREGMEIVIRRTGRRGRVLRKDRGPRWLVETETMRLSLLPAEMRPAEQAPVQTGVQVSFTKSEAAELPVVELDLRGMRVEEAIRRLERQIDSALVYGLGRFGVIHGKGDGILQKAIHGYLKTAGMVQDYHFSAPDEGGFGKTFVVLKG